MTYTFSAEGVATAGAFSRLERDEVADHTGEHADALCTLIKIMHGVAWKRELFVVLYFLHFVYIRKRITCH